MTVGDDSVSRVISLRLDEAQAIAEGHRDGSMAGVSVISGDGSRTTKQPNAPLPEIDLEAPEPDPADFDLEPSETIPPAPEPSGTPGRSTRAAGVAPLPPGALWGAGARAGPAERAGRPRAGLAKTRGGFVSRLRGLPRRRRGEAAWDEVEETLIAGDVGALLAMEVVERARGRRDPGGAEAAVRAELAALLVPRDAAWSPQASVEGGPAIVLVVGVNGTGKTTTIGKLAAATRAEGRRVLLAAADTFRAAAIDQLGSGPSGPACPSSPMRRTPIPAPSCTTRSTPPSREAPTWSSPTPPAGSTRSRTSWTSSTKIRRSSTSVCRAPCPRPSSSSMPTTGQNGLAQAKAFHEAVGLTGIVLTKLDSTAKGGIVFAIEHDLGVPVRFVGVGEKAGDLLPFDPEAFVAALFG